MHPEIALDARILAENVRAWRALARVPVRPVVKCDGYGWGARELVRALDAHCDAYCVADFEEARVLRAMTEHRIVALGRLPAADLHAALDANVIPSIETAQDVERCAAWQEARGTIARVRVGIAPAASWSGVSMEELDALAQLLARARLEVEVWTHVTNAAQAPRQMAVVPEAVGRLQRAGANVVGSDAAGTFALVQNGAGGSNVRIGAGLFGATGGAAVAGVRCALRVEAPVVRRDYLRRGARVGYASRELDEDGYVLTARCGYGEGLPKGLAGTSDILSVGMQYVTLRAAGHDAARVTLIGPQTDLDAFAAAAGTSSHELITALGNASQRMHAANRNR